MTTLELLAYLEQLDVDIQVVGDRLQMNAPKGVLTPELRAELQTHKAELIRILGNGYDTPAQMKAAASAAGEARVPSFAQEQFWLIEQVSPGNSAYVMTVSYRLRGALDVPALRKALQGLVQRHDALRTVFERGPEGPVPVVRGEVGPVLSVEDLSEGPAREDGPAANREEEGYQRLEAWLAEPIDLATGPIFKARLYTLAGDDHLLGLAVHHIASDGWSRGLLIKELSELYAAAVERRPGDALPPLELGYADFARWQRGRLTDARLAELVKHWREAINGADLTLDLPSDRPRPPVQTFRGRRQAITLTGSLARDLRSLARERKVTHFTLFLSAFQALLHRLSGQEDILVGIPASIRDRVELEALVGPFVNTVLIRSSSADDPSFVQHLERTRARVLDAMEHRELPFERLVRELQVERDPSRNPLFQAMFDFSPAAGGLRLSGVDVERLQADSGGALVDLSLTVEDSDNQIKVVAHYNDDIYETATIERWLGHYRRLLEAIASDPQQAVSAMPMLAWDDLQAMLVAWNQTAVEFPGERCIHELFAAQVARVPDNIAVSYEDDRLTYAELAARAHQLANRLVELGVGPGDIVAVSLARSTNVLVCLLGVLEAGATYLPLDPTYPQQRLTFMLEDAAAKVLLTDAETALRLGPTQAEKVLMDRDAERIAAAPERSPERRPTPADVAYVIYTSGSTGLPKGVRVSHRAAVNLLTSMVKEPGLSETDILAAVTTISFDISLLELLGPLCVGARVALVPSEIAADGRRLKVELDRLAATVMQATPTTWRLLAQAGWTAKKLRAWCGGEALPRDLAKEMLPNVDELWNLYGPTETTIWSTCSRIADPEAPILIGRPIANTRTYVLDRHRQPVPVGVAGELYIGGVGVSEGYLNRPELTEERFVTVKPLGAPPDRAYKTGDLVRYRPDGQLDYLSRMDGQVKVRGFRIELGEIEAVMAEHESVERAVANACTVGPGDVRLVGYVVPRDLATFQTAKLRDFLRERLPAPLVPAHIEVMERLPLTNNGKIDRKALPKVGPGQAGPVRESGIEPPETPAELAIARAWREILKIEDISVDDNFFDLGGHSLLAMQVVFRLERELGHRFTPVELSIQTLGQLAAACEVQEHRERRVTEKPRAKGLLGGVLGKVTAKMREAFK